MVGMWVFCLALASFYLGTSCVRCPPTQYPTNNQPPSHLNISINTGRTRTFYVAILCACMVDRRLCSIIALFQERRWDNANSDMSNGRMHRQRSQTDENVNHRKLNSEVQHQLDHIYGANFQLDQGQFISKFSIMASAGRKGNTIRNGTQHARI
jgi:hypothetical protein